MSYTHLSREERYLIYHLLHFGLSDYEIAARLGRSASTISRELRRNAQRVEDYWYESAQRQSEERVRGVHQGQQRHAPQVGQYVACALREHWSPEAISARMRLDFPRNQAMRISHEGIYQWVYRDARTGGDLYTCLRRGHRRRRQQRKRLRGVGHIKERVGIEQRPGIVQRRGRFGDWESDTMQGAARQGGGLATHVERKSRYLVAARLADDLSIAPPRASCVKVSRPSRPSLRVIARP